MQDLVSIVMPVYNVEDFLDRSVGSVVNQTYKNLEIILVDDGSVDASPAMCDEWARKDSRIKVFHKENAGPGTARNTGIDNATGKYIFFLDSDDSVDETLVEKCVNSARENNSQVVLFSRNNIYDDGKVVHKKVNVPAYTFDNNGIVNQLLPSLFSYKMGFGVSPWSKMYDLEIIKSLGVRFMSERETTSEDAYFALEFYPRLEAASVVPECLYNYYIRDNSFSRAYKPGRQARNNEFLNLCVSYVNAKGLPQVLITNITNRYHTLTLSTLSQIAKSDISAKEKKRAIKEIFTDSVLRNTLSKDALSLSSSVNRLFWQLLKFKCYYLCYLLLLYKSGR